MELMQFGGGLTRARITIRDGEKVLHFATFVGPGPPGFRTSEPEGTLHISEKPEITVGGYGGPGFGWKEFDTSLVKKIILPEHYNVSESYELIFRWIFR
jgi:hypothetical protein